MTDISSRIAFFKIDNDTCTILRDFYPIVEKEMPSILDAFYTYILSNQATAALFGASHDEIRARSASASKGQVKHWQRLFSGAFDADYVNSVQKIGQIHNRIGLEPSRYIGGYLFILNKLNDLIADHCASRLQPTAARKKAAAIMTAVNKAVMLDMDLAISTYLDALRQSHDSHLADRFNLSVRKIIDNISGSVSALSDSADAMTGTVELTREQASAAAEAAGQASSNTQSVAAATEELAASSGEIARQVERAAAIAGSAVDEATRANETVSILSNAADGIGRIIELIQAISSQTRLLALNATIEAARAGDTGRGFAVVASEVKELAAQTGKATEDIAAQVAAIRKAAIETVGAIDGISATIGEINSISGAIAAAVQEQLATTDEISRSVQQAAGETAGIAGNMRSVITAAGNAAQSGQEVSTVALRLASDAGALEQEAARFLSSIDTD